MLEINASPELCYVLWCMVTAFDFCVFALWACMLQSVVVHKRGKAWYIVCVFFLLLTISSILLRLDRVSAWYNILAQLKGW